MTALRLDHVNIRTANLTESIDFYGRVLGLRVVPPPIATDLGKGAYACDAAGHPVVHLIAADCLVQGPEPVRGTAQKGMIDHFALRCQGAEAYVTRIIRAGLIFNRMDVPAIGMHLIFVRDPNGIMVELGFPLVDLCHEDRQAITDQLNNYARAMDRIDHALAYAVWHEDGTADYGPMFSGTGHAFVDWVCETHGGMIGHAHRITNILIRLDGTRASSEAYVHATLRFEQEGKLRQASVFGRYLDRWSKRDGRWAIDARVYVQDIDDIRDVGTQIVTPWGQRDQSDPSYAVLDGI